MKTRRLNPVVLSLLPMAATVISLSSCANRTADTPIPAAPAANPVTARLVQIGFGDQADFVQCVPPLCPTPTPKTIAVVPESPTVEAATGGMNSATPPEIAGNPPSAVPPAAEMAPPASTEVLTWSIGFAFGRARLDAAGRQALEKIAAELPDKGHITIAGRTDNAGSSATNDALAKARAETVHAHLMRLRPDLQDAITTEAMGKCCFAAPNDTASGRARNRRVEITLAPP